VNWQSEINKSGTSIDNLIGIVKNSANKTVYMKTPINPATITTIAFASEAPTGFAYAGTLSNGIKVYLNQTQVVFVLNSISLPNDCTDMFLGLSSVTSINFTSTGTSNMQNVVCKNMFKDCSSLTTITGLDFGESTKVTSTAYMFSGCSKITSAGMIYLGRLSEIEDMSYMFENCMSLTNPYLSGKQEQNDVGQTITFDGMYQGCESLTTFCWELETHGVTGGFIGVFDYCYGLTTLDLSGCYVPDGAYWGTINLGSTARLTTFITPVFNSAINSPTITIKEDYGPIFESSTYVKETGFIFPCGETSITYTRQLSSSFTVQSLSELKTQMKEDENNDYVFEKKKFLLALASLVKGDDEEK